MKTSKCAAPLIICGILSLATPARCQMDLVDKSQKPLPSASPGKWWQASWEKGYQYQHEAHFELSCETKLVPGQKANWISKTAASQVELVANLRIDGQANVRSFVIDGSPNPFLGRYYEAVHSSRQLSGKVKTLTPIATKVHEWLFAEGQVKKNVTNAVATIAKVVKTIITKNPTPDKVDVLFLTAATWLGNKAEELFRKTLQEKGLEYTQDGFEVKSTGGFASLPFGSDLQNVNNLAVQLTEGFRNRAFFIEQDGKKLNLSQVEDIKQFQTILEKPSKARQAARRLPEPADRVKAVLQRETLALNEHIFDSKQRKVGDVWDVDGPVFSTFLHPDLKGAFEGRAVLKYEENVSREVTIAATSGTKVIKYNAKQLHLVSTAEVKNGSIRKTDLQYTENNFKAKVNDGTEAYIYVDNENGMVREAILDFVAEGSQKSLPSMLLTRGFEAQGTARLSVRYMADRIKLDQAAQSAEAP